MLYCFYIAIILLLITIQTAVIPHFRLFNSFYDLLIPHTICLGLFRPIRESLIVVVIQGLIMDNISGSYFGLYTTTYLWLFVGATWIVKFLHVQNRVLLIFSVACGVLIECFIFLGSIMIFRQDFEFCTDAVNTIALQTIWALFSGQLLLISFNRFYKRIDNWRNEIIP